MKHLAGALAAISLASVISAAAPAAQGASAADAHFAKATQAAQRDYTDIFDTSCGYIRPTMVINTTPAPPSVGNDPKTWHAEPVKVFDNLYLSDRASTRRGRSPPRTASS